MFWFVVLSTVLLGVGAIVFVLARDAFHAPHARREAPNAASPEQQGSDAINILMREKLAAPPSPQHATLFAGQHDKETDALADSLAEVKEIPQLPTAPKAYLRLEERDESLERLLIRYTPGRGGVNREQPPPREFSIGVTEKTEPPLEHEKEIFAKDNKAQPAPDKP